MRDLATAYARDQAQRTLAALGYNNIVGLSENTDGSWRADVQKGSESWRVQVSRYGAVSAYVTAPLVSAPSLSLGGVQ